MAADDKSSSSTEFSSEAAVISPASPSHLTHFKPLTPEQDEPPLRSAYSSFVSLFRFNNRGEGVGGLLVDLCFLSANVAVETEELVLPSPPAGFLPDSETVGLCVPVKNQCLLVLLVTNMIIKGKSIFKECLSEFLP
uniref:Uncharacterized protein n=1 Tax=Oryzias sinensis TaxID=183150 RepID=A0A8C7X4F0_9TELE